MRTKNLALIVIILLFSSFASKAQYKPFVFGFKVAPGIGWLKTDTKNYSGGSSLGFSWGIVGEFNFSESYCLATGVNFVFANSNVNYPDMRTIIEPTELQVDRKLRIKYLQVPLALKMRTGEIGKMRFFGQFGLGTGFRLNAKGKDEYSFSSKTYNETNNIDGEISFIRESLLVGIGTEYKLKGGSLLSAGISLDNGFTDILADKNNVDPTLKPKATNSFVELSLGILF
jgi:hypothetical protein